MPSLALALIRGYSEKVALPIFGQPIVPGQREFTAMLTQRRREMIKLTEEFLTGFISPSQWDAGMRAILLEGHTQAALMGRQLALDEAVAADLQDLLRGHAATDAEEFYLRGFSQALIDHDPRYYAAETAEWNASAIVDRQTSYLGAMRGTANGAFISESPEDADIYWIDTGGPNECDECKTYAAGSPYKANELDKHPGENRTPCLFNCKCHLKIDGKTGFKPVDI